MFELQTREQNFTEQIPIERLHGTSDIRSVEHQVRTLRPTKKTDWELQASSIVAGNNFFTEAKV